MYRTHMRVLYHFCCRQSHSSVHNTLHSYNFTNWFYLHITHYTLHITHYTLHITHYTLHTISCRHTAGHSKNDDKYWPRPHSTFSKEEVGIVLLTNAVFLQKLCCSTGRSPRCLPPRRTTSQPSPASASSTRWRAPASAGPRARTS